MATTDGLSATCPSQNLSAQFLSEQGLVEIAAAFVRAPEEHSNIRESDAEGIAVIDPAMAGTAEIGEACYEWGFFQVVNHGVPLKLLECASNFSRSRWKRRLWLMLAPRRTWCRALAYGMKHGHGVQQRSDTTEAETSGTNFQELRPTPTINGAITVLLQDDVLGLQVMRDGS